MTHDFSTDLLKTRNWQGHTPDTPEEEAAAKFRARYHADPQYIIEDHNALFVGPIPQKEINP